MMSRLPGKILKCHFFSNFPLQILAFKTGNHNISNIILAGSFKNDQLVEMMRGLPGENLKKKVILFFVEIALCKFVQ